MILTALMLMGLQKPKMPETVQEYMERGRAWTEYIESLKERKEDLYEELGTKMSLANTDGLIEAPEVDGCVFYGSMELTAYIETGNPCADGVYPEVGVTVACNDPNLWHKWIYIEGVGARYVHDTGGMASDVIDVYVGDYETAVLFGRWSSNVYILE